MRLRIRCLVYLLAPVLVLVLLSCGRAAYRAGHPRVGGPVVGAPGECTDYSGIWTTNLGKMEFNQAGCRISGAGRISGEYVDIQGEVQAGQFNFHWVGKNRNGYGYLIVDAAGDRITGEYGLGTGSTGGGAITGEKRR